MGDINAPGKFLEVVKIIFETVEDSSNYMDDLTISNDDAERLLKSFIDTLIRAKRFNAFFKPTKTKIGTKEAETLGYVASADGYRPQEKHIKKLLEAECPTTHSLLLSFWG